MPLSNNLWYLGAQFMTAIQARDRNHAKRLLQKILKLIELESGTRFSYFKLRTLQVMTNANRAAFAAGAPVDLLDAHSHHLVERIDQAHQAAKLKQIALTTLAQAIDLIPDGNAYRESIVQDAITYIRENFAQTLSRNDLANRLQCSPAHFSRVFAKTTGYTFKDFLLQCRLEKAKELLRHSRLQIAEIALAVGYEDQFQFSKTFRKRIGASPSQFRESRINPTQPEPMQ